MCACIRPDGSIPASRIRHSGRLWLQGVALRAPKLYGTEFTAHTGREPAVDAHTHHPSKTATVLLSNLAIVNSKRLQVDT
jgi:hypothetical protein